MQCEAIYVYDPVPPFNHALTGHTYRFYTYKIALYYIYIHIKKCKSLILKKCVLKCVLNTQLIVKKL